jgi:competence protein ComEC
MKELRTPLVATMLTLVLLFTPFACDKAAEKPLLKVAFLDIGQGDSIYIEAPNGNQMIIDGGPSGNLAGPLSQVMPFGDRSVNVIMVTNPDSDHYAGYLDILKSGYNIGAVIEPGTHTPTPTHAAFEKEIADKNIPEIRAWKGMTIDIDKEDGVTFTVLFPDRDVSTWTTNDGSIEGILSYGTTRVMFTGDGSKRTESIILADNPASALKADILKAAHHGSATASSDEFVAAVDPKYAIISSEKGNRYGLPKQVTLDTFARHNIETLRTDALGTIVFTSDGATFTEQK